MGEHELLNEFFEAVVEGSVVRLFDGGELVDGSRKGVFFKCGVGNEFILLLECEGF